MLKEVDYLIVGQGLAGSCLALHLLKVGKTFHVFDKSSANTATLVAAGLFNPITGRGMTKTWLADSLFPYLHSFYREAETTTKSNFFYVKPLYRPFINIEEQNEWMARSADESFRDYLKTIHASPINETEVHNPFGGIFLTNSGYLNTFNFKSAVKNLLEEHEMISEGFFDEEELRHQPDGVLYKDFRARKIIFCTGETARSSYWLSWLPIRPLKGETMTIKTPASIDVIYNRGVYVVPEIWRVGATYAKGDETPSITSTGQNELELKLKELIAFPYEITDRNWGIRPTTPDRKPMLGVHPGFENIVIFNGLGTKGVSLAPFFANQLVLWLENGKPLNKEVDINRYKSLY